MKFSSVLCAALVAVAALTLASQSALADANQQVVTSFRAINVNDPAAVAACKKGGGTVSKDAKGKDTCITPKKK